MRRSDRGANVARASAADLVGGRSDAAAVVAAAAVVDDARAVNEPWGDMNVLGAAKSNSSDATVGSPVHATAARLKGSSRVSTATWRWPAYATRRGSVGCGTAVAAAATLNDSQMAETVITVVTDFHSEPVRFTNAWCCAPKARRSWPPPARPPPRLTQFEQRRRFLNPLNSNASRTPAVAERWARNVVAATTKNRQSTASVTIGTPKTDAAFAAAAIGVSRRRLDRTNDDGLPGRRAADGAAPADAPRQRSGLLAWLTHGVAWRYWRGQPRLAGVEDRQHARRAPAPAPAASAPVGAAMPSAASVQTAVAYGGFCAKSLASSHRRRASGVRDGPHTSVRQTDGARRPQSSLLFASSAADLSWSWCLGASAAQRLFQRFLSLSPQLLSLLLLLFSINAPTFASSSASSVDVYASSADYKVDCNEHSIRVRVNLQDKNYTAVYLENFKGFPGCSANMTSDGTAAIFDISLLDDFRCGIGKMTNKHTGLRTYFHRIVLEESAFHDPGGNGRTSTSTSSVAAKVGSANAGPAVLAGRPAGGSRSERTEGASERRRRAVFFFKCQQADRRRELLAAAARAKRGAKPQFPFELVEPDHLNITEYIEAHAPIPYLEIGIRQNGRLLDTAHDVQPGTALEMVIYLDARSKSTYGILTTFLKVSDSAGKQEEVIIMNGCSIDPYIFSNFETPDGGDTLTASFKAFKFPESNYVLFSGTVSICINKCKGIPCGVGQLGYGRRRRREIPAALPRDPNALYSVELSTVLKVRFDDDVFKLNKGSLSGEITRNASLRSQNFVEAQTRSVLQPASPEHQMFASDACSLRPVEILLTLALTAVHTKLLRFFPVHN